MANEATGIMISENLPEDIDLEKLEDFDNIDDGDFIDWVNAPGRYLATCVNVKTQDDTKHKPSENLMFKVLGGTPDSQKGKMFMERVYHTAVDRALKLGKRMKVWSSEQHQEFLDAMREGQAAAGPNFAPCVGKQFVVIIKASEYDGKEQLKMDYMGIWPTDHPSVLDFVKGLGGSGSGKPAANATTKAEPAPATNGKATTTTTRKAAAPAKKPAAAVDEL